MTSTKIQHDVLTGGQAKLALRVLSGPNMGAETLLGEGAWLIGSHDSDDLTFGDSELVGSHIRIVIETGTLQVTALAPGVVIGNRETPINSPTILDPFTLVRIGRTIFTLGPVGRDFPDVNSVGEHERVDAKHFPSAPAESPTLDSRRTRLAIGSMRPRLRQGAVVCGILIVSYGSWVGIGRLRASTGVTILSSRPITTPTDIFPGSRAPNVTRPDDKIATRLRPGENTNLQASGPALVVDVASQRPTVTALSHTKLIELATTVLRAFDIEGNIRVEGAGQIAVTGYGRSDAKVEAALRRLQQDIPGVHKVNDEVVTPDRARAFLEAAASTELRSSIRIVAKPDVVSVSGALTSATYNEWQNVASRFEEKFMPYIRLESQCELMELPVARGVHVGRTPFIILQNGTRLKVGDSVDRLGKIATIERDGVVVHVGASDLRVLYSSKPEWITEEDQR